MYRYIENHRSNKALVMERPWEYKNEMPAFESKQEARSWFAEQSTSHAFITLCEGVNPNSRINVENPVSRIHGVIADYDSPAPADLEDFVNRCDKIVCRPTWLTRTSSGNFRMIWEFTDSILIDESYSEKFLTEFCKAVKCLSLFAGFDVCSYKASQVYEIGTDWTRVGDATPPEWVSNALFKAIGQRASGRSFTVPMDAVEKEVLERWPHRVNQLKLGDRVPLFWVDDGIDRIGGQVAEDGVVCYSDRAGSAFVGWTQILGMDFVRRFEQRKVSEAVTNVWYDGKRYFRFTQNGLFDSPKEDVQLNLKNIGLNADKKKGQRLTEVEQAFQYIHEQNRVHGSAPILYDKRKVVTINGSVILNSAQCEAVKPAESGDPENWKWLHGFFSTFLDDPDGSGPLDYMYSWIKRAYESMHYGELLQGQAMLLVGPTARGKSLFANRILAGLLGGATNASDFLQAKTNFNKELAEKPVWAIDDAVSGANAADHRRFTELLKSHIANPMIDVQAKYQNSMRVPWGGRIIISLNEDVQSLSIIPSLDMSNADKLMGFRIAESHRPKFLPNREMEKLIANELPYFAKFLLDYEIPEHIVGNARFGVKPYMHPFVMNAARDNGSKAPALEAIELFVRVHREATQNSSWYGTATDLRSLFSEYETLRGLNMSRDQYTLARGLAAAEEHYNTDPENARPVTSTSSGKGKRYKIDLSEDYDDDTNIICGA